MKILVRSFISKKTGNPCFALVADLKYREAFLSFDKYLCAEILGISVEELYALAPNDYEVSAK